jgi:beta-glucosidase
VLSANIDPAAAREADLLAFEIGIEQGRPHAVMCAYNRVNGIYSCENDFLLSEVLKRDWAYPGFVMSDWGAVHSTEKAAVSGLDQESGAEMDSQIFFGMALKEAVEMGKVPIDRLNDMVRRILRAMFRSGIVDDPPKPGGIMDYELHAQTAQIVAEHGLVLLRNDNGALPLHKGLRRIVVIGSHADKGVLSGGGSSQVIPLGGVAVPNLGPSGFPGPLVYDPSSPLRAIEAEAGGAEIEYVGGDEISRAVQISRGADAVIVFAHQWMAEMLDAPDLSLPHDQDQLIAAVGATNKNTIVVLETGGPVRMPWLSLTAGVIEAWYPGVRGGEAIARVLFGQVNPSGRLPMTFPVDESQLLRTEIPGKSGSEKPNVKQELSEEALQLNYFEGAQLGYKWFDANGTMPLYPFGFGLSYTDFTYTGLTTITSGTDITITLDVKNVGPRQGADVPQFYLRCSGDTGFPMRLVGWSVVPLDPGETRRVMLTVDPRLSAHFDVASNDWEILPRRCTLAAGANARDIRLKTEVILGTARLKP